MYHSPSNRIGSNYSPQARFAASVLFEQFPSDPNAPRTRGTGQLAELKAMYTTSKPLSPRWPLLGATGTKPEEHEISLPRGQASGYMGGVKRGSPDSPLDGTDLEGRWAKGEQGCCNVEQAGNGCRDVEQAGNGYDRNVGM